MDFIIRDVMRSDFDAIHAFFAENFRFHRENMPDAFQDADPLSSEEFASWFERERVVLLAEVDGIAVATISAFKPKRLKNVPSVKARNLYQISDIFVDHAYRRNGIGEALYAEARRRVIEQGGEGLSFNVWAFNADARRFYDRIGAKCVSHHYEDYD